MTVSYSIFFPIVPGISDKYKGCDPRYFVGYIFDETLEDHPFTVKYTRMKGYEGIMFSSQSRDFIWSVQDQTDHGHLYPTPDEVEEYKTKGDWDQEDQMYWEYRCILEDLNDGLN